MQLLIGVLVLAVVTGTILYFVKRERPAASGPANPGTSAPPSAPKGPPAAQ